MVRMILRMRGSIVATVATVGTATLDVRLAAERHAACTAVAGLDVKPGLVDEGGHWRAGYEGRSQPSETVCGFCYSVSRTGSPTIAADQTVWSNTFAPDG